MRLHWLCGIQELHKLVEGIPHPVEVNKMRDKLETFWCQRRKSISFVLLFLAVIWVKGFVFEHGGAPGFHVLRSAPVEALSPANLPGFFSACFSVSCTGDPSASLTAPKSVCASLIFHGISSCRSLARVTAVLGAAMPQGNLQSMLPGKRVRGFQKIRAKAVDAGEDVRFVSVHEVFSLIFRSQGQPSSVLLSFVFICLQSFHLPSLLELCFIFFSSYSFPLYLTRASTSSPMSSTVPEWLVEKNITVRRQ